MKRLRLFSLPLVLVLSSLVWTSCGSDGTDDDDGDDQQVGDGSGATCPQGSTLTYANFGQAFMDSYCLRCHSSTLTGGGRIGAPANINFDTQAEIQALAELIDEEAAAGPDNVNTDMPPSAPRPTQDERLKLGEWLACGAP